MVIFLDFSKVQIVYHPKFLPSEILKLPYIQRKERKEYKEKKEKNSKKRKKRIQKYFKSEKSSSRELCMETESPQNDW